MYESLIKVTKRAWRVTVGEQILSWNEMATVFAEVKERQKSVLVSSNGGDPPFRYRNNICFDCANGLLLHLVLV